MKRDVEKKERNNAARWMVRIRKDEAVALYAPSSKVLDTRNNGGRNYFVSSMHKLKSPKSQTFRSKLLCCPLSIT